MMYVQTMKELLNTMMTPTPWPDFFYQQRSKTEKIVSKLNG